MGRLTINAVYQQDYPMVLWSGIFFAALTIIGYLLTEHPECASFTCRVWF